MQVRNINRGGFARAAYDARNHRLIVEFEDGRVSAFKAVGETLARRFLTSGAPASVFKDAIEDEFTEEPLQGFPADEGRGGIDALKALFGG